MKIAIFHRRFNIFRESVTISKGTKDGGMLTHINNKNLFMTGVHIAHDCKISNENILLTKHIGWSLI